MVPKTHQRKLSEIGEILIKHLNDFMEKEGDVLYCIEVGQRYLSSDYCNSTDIPQLNCRILKLIDCHLNGIGISL